MSNLLRRSSAEFIGTFAIVFSSVLLSATGQTQGTEGLICAAFVSGLSVCAMIYALGHISFAHFNPAVTLGFAIASRFRWRDVPAYWAAQFFGAILAAMTVATISRPGAGAHIPSIASIPAASVEAIITFFLMLVIISVATDDRVDRAVTGLSIGLMVVVGVFIAGPLTGGSMNPARSLGPALFNHAALAHVWIYFLGPCTGAVLAALVYEALRKPEQTAIALV